MTAAIAIVLVTFIASLFDMTILEVIIIIITVIVVTIVTIRVAIKDGGAIQGSVILDSTRAKLMVRAETVY